MGRNSDHPDASEGLGIIESLKTDDVANTLYAFAV